MIYLKPLKKVFLQVFTCVWLYSLDYSLAVNFTNCVLDCMSQEWNELSQLGGPS